jgi:hypothetical protein
MIQNNFNSFKNRNYYFEEETKLKESTDQLQKAAVFPYQEGKIELTLAERLKTREDVESFLDADSYLKKKLLTKKIQNLSKTPQEQNSSWLSDMSGRILTSTSFLYTTFAGVVGSGSYSYLLENSFSSCIEQGMKDCYNHYSPWLSTF